MERKNADNINDKWFDGMAFQESSNDPEFTEIAASFLCGDILGTKGALGDKQRALLILASLTASQTLNFTIISLRSKYSFLRKSSLIKLMIHIGCENKILFILNDFI